MTPLEVAKDRITIPQLAALRGWAWKPGKSCHIPYQQDRNASGSVLAGDRLFHDFTSGETLDAPALLARVENITNEAACKLLIQLAGSSDYKSPAKQPPRQADHIDSEKPREKPRLPALTIPTREELATIAQQRNLSAAATRLASKRGFLFTTRVNNIPCWAITDRTRWLCQLRRMDGQAFPRRDATALRERKSAASNSRMRQLAGFKAWTVTGSRGAWPIGCEESARFGSIALVEGGGDFLAAFHFIIAEERGRDVAPVAMLGASNRIAPETLKLFRAKSVRIFPHVDPPNSKGASPGLEAAARWQQQLTDAGAIVHCFDLSGLKQINGTPVTDLNDMTRLHPDELNRDGELAHLMDF
jgi:hypothetical protein